MSSKKKYPYSESQWGPIYFYCVEKKNKNEKRKENAFNLFVIIFL